MNARATIRIFSVIGHAGLGFAHGLVIARRRKRQDSPFDGSLPVAMAIDRLARKLGGLFPKLAQIVSTRHDLLSPDAITLLSRSCDRLDMQPAHSRKRKTAGCHGARTISIIGSGAIAEVFLTAPDKGESVVIKARRPAIDVLLASDIAVMNALAGLAGRTGLVKSLNLSANAALFSDLLSLQLDFAAESRNLKQLRSNLAGHATVPRVFATGGAERLYMQYLPRGNDLTDVTPEHGKRLAIDVMRLMYRMVFIDGLIHCDLHGGNIYLGEDGDIVIVDAGFCAHIAPVVRSDFREFFLAIGLKRAAILAELIIRYSTGPRAPDLQRRMTRQCTDLVDRHSGLKAGEFHLISFIKDLYKIYDCNGLTMTSDFFAIIYALLVVEGLVIRLDPELDFQALAFDFMIACRDQIFAS
ncbi:AarF/UbiB family protein [Roseibium sp.]|uniref:AarF/UbiB family protein n=1 Tax=Roseibium sp. TaxID=1936156 RepID=UPI003265E70D